MFEFVFHVGVDDYLAIERFFGPSLFSKSSVPYIVVECLESSPWICVQGKRVLVTHHEGDGKFPSIENIDEVLKETGADYIVCCFPKSAPDHLPVLGDWGGMTGLYAISCNKRGPEYVGEYRLAGFEGGSK